MSDEQQKQHSQLRLENKTEHVLHIALTGGAVISVPPAENEGQGKAITFATAEERARFERAMQTETVQRWIRDKELVVHGGGDAPPAPTPSSTTTQQQQTDPAAGAPQTGSSRRGRGGQE